jgi:hypothetical protein
MIERSAVLDLVNPPGEPAGRKARPLFATADSRALATFVVGAIVFFGLFVLVPRAMLTDPDTLWHMFFGRLIASTGHFPHVDEWSYTAAGQPWIAKEWLSQILLAGADRAAGYNGVVGLAAASTAIAFALLAWFSLQRLPPLLALFCVAAALALCLEHLVARPHLLAFPYFVVWFAGIARACDRGEPPSLLLLPVMVLWANLHAGFTLGLVFAGLFAGCSVWEAGRAGWPLVRPWALFLVAAALAACITPYGFGPFQVTWKLMSFGPVLGNITEWAPPNFQADKTSLAVILVWVGIGLSTGPRYSLPRVLMILFLCYLFLTASRNGDPMGLALPFLLAPTSEGRRKAGTASARVLAAPGGVLVAAFVASIAVAAALRPGLRPFDNLTPAPCLEQAAAQGLLGRRMLNDYDYGGYLITRGIKTFIDGRTELFGPAALEAYSRFAVLQADDPAALLEKQAIEWTLLQPKLPVVKYLDHLPGWQRTFTTDTCILHVRTGPRP